MMMMIMMITQNSPVNRNVHLVIESLVVTVPVSESLQAVVVEKVPHRLVDELAEDFLHSLIA